MSIKNNEDIEKFAETILSDAGLPSIFFSSNNRRMSCGWTLQYAIKNIENSKYKDVCKAQGFNINEVAEKLVLIGDISYNIKNDMRKKLINYVIKHNFDEDVPLEIEIMQKEINALNNNMEVSARCYIDGNDVTELVAEFIEAKYYSQRNNIGNFFVFPVPIIRIKNMLQKPNTIKNVTKGCSLTEYCLGKFIQLAVFSKAQTSVYSHLFHPNFCYVLDMEKIEYVRNKIEYILISSNSLKTEEERYKYNIQNRLVASKAFKKRYHVTIAETCNYIASANLDDEIDFILSLIFPDKISNIYFCLNVFRYHHPLGKQYEVSDIIEKIIERTHSTFNKGV